MHPGSNSRCPPRKCSLDDHVVFAKITSIDRARCEQSGKADVPCRRRGDPVRQSVRASHFRLVLSTLQDVSQRNIHFFTCGCAVETEDGEQEMEHTTVTYDAAAERVPNRVEGHISASDRKMQLRHLIHEMFVSRTHQKRFCARVYDHGQLLV